MRPVLAILLALAPLSAQVARPVSANARVIGAVFTTELSPVFTPGLSPFQPNISQQDKEKVRQRKLARLPVVERLMNSMLQSAAKDLAVPDDQQIVVAVNFVYLPYEDTTGLPGQMVVKGTRHAILSGAQIAAMVTNQ